MRAGVGVFCPFSVCCWVPRGVRSPASLPAASLRVRPMWPGPPSPSAAAGLGSAVLGSVGSRSVVCFLVGFQCVAVCSFSRLGRLFWGLGRLFWGLGCLPCAVVFRIFVSFFASVLWVLPFSHRLLPWWLLSASRACALCSLGAWSASLRGLARFRRVGWPRRVPPSRARWSGAGFARGRSRGRSLRWWLGLGACPCCRAVSPPLAFSFPCSLNFF